MYQVSWILSKQQLLCINIIIIHRLHFLMLFTLNLATHSYQTRPRKALHIPSVHTNVSKQTICCGFIGRKVWNQLDQNICRLAVYLQFTALYVNWERQTFVSSIQSRRQKNISCMLKYACVYVHSWLLCIVYTSMFNMYGPTMVKSRLSDWMHDTLYAGWTLLLLNIAVICCCLYCLAYQYLTYYICSCIARWFSVAVTHWTRSV